MEWEVYRRTNCNNWVESHRDNPDVFRAGSGIPVAIAEGMLVPSPSGLSAALLEGVAAHRAGRDGIKILLVIKFNLH